MPPLRIAALSGATALTLACAMTSLDPPAMADPPSGITPQPTDIVAVGSQSVQALSDQLATAYDTTGPALAVQYGDRTGNRVVIPWPLTQPELASLAAVAEPTAQKALRTLRERGVIETGYRSLAILDLDELNRIAGV
jgi:Crp-like helix-turn-helix domain